MGIERFLTENLSNAAYDKFIQSKNKIFDYTWFNSDYSVKQKSGKCIVTSRRYSIVYDCDIISIKDIETEESITDDIFHLSLKETE